MTIGGQLLSQLRDNLLVPAGTYRVEIACDPDLIRAAQRLRFTVFNLELQEGLAEAFVTGLDRDPFDEVCDHLLIIHCATAEVIGTYRMQAGLNAARHLGYYSAQEFDFSPYESIRPQIIELGRACIRQDHRNFTVLSLLWRGIAVYATERGARYLIGCSSLTSQDEREGASAYYALARQHLVEQCWLTSPREGFACSLAVRADQETVPPKLLRAYLNVGARICGPPAIDREFGTIDFLTMLDMVTMPESTRQRFLSA